jgi:hypothetical protein
MKTLLFIYLMLVLCLSVKAQKLEKPRIDKITGDTTYETSRERICTNTGFFGSDILFVTFNKVKGNIIASFHILRTNANSHIFSINKGNRAIIKYKDGTTTILNAIVSQIADGNVSSYGNIVTSDVQVDGLYDITTNDVNSLIKNDLTIIRIETSVGNIDYEINAKHSAVINKCVSLISGK